MIRGLPAYLAGATCARLADEGVAVAVTLLALERTGGPGQGAAVLAAWMAPHAVAAPLAGTLAARSARSARSARGARGARGARARGTGFHSAALVLFAAAIALLAFTLGRAPLGAALAVAAFGGCCGPVVTGGLSSLLAGMATTPADRTRAYGLDAATYNAAGITGPALVAAASGVWGPGPAMTLLSAAALAAGAGLYGVGRRMRPRPAAGARAGGAESGAPSGGVVSAAGSGASAGGGCVVEPGGPSGGGCRAVSCDSPGGITAAAESGGSARGASAAQAGGGPALGMKAELAAGLRALWRIRPLRAVTGATGIAFLGIGGLTPAVVLLADARDYPGGGGLLITVLAIGALVGSLAAARRPPGLSDLRLVAACLLGTGIALPAAAAATPFPLCAALFAAAGLCDGPLLAATLRIRADHAPPDVRDQVFTLGAGVKVSAAAAGAALAGAGATAGLSAGELLAGIALLQAAAVLPLPYGRLPTAG